MTVHDDEVGADSQDNGRASTDGHASTARDARRSPPQQQDYVHHLAATIGIALKQRSRTEPVIVSRMQQRAELYEKAYVQAKQAAIDTMDTVDKNTSPTERHVRQVEALRKPEFEVLPPEVVIKLAAMDARQFGKLRDPEHRAAAALAMADIARLSTGYRNALSNTSPEVSSVVQAAADTTQQGTTVPIAGDKPDVPRDQANTTPARGAAMPGELRTIERLGLNSIEQVIEQQRDARRAQPEQQRAEPTGPEVKQPKGIATHEKGGNEVATDELFSAVNNEGKPIVPAEVEDKYLRVGSKFYHPKYTHVVAFEDKGNKLETRSNSEQIAGAMVAIARARGWDEIKVAGSETFRMEVWLEAAAHGMHVKGYTPKDVDKAELAKRSRYAEGDQAPLPSTVHATLTDKTNKAVPPERAEERQPEPKERQRAQAFAQRAPLDAVADHPELAGAYAAMASIDKKLAVDGLSPQQRSIVMARVEANLVNSIERGQLPVVKMREARESVDAQREPAQAKERTR